MYSPCWEQMAGGMGASQPSLPSREGRRAGVASGAGSAGELPASALTLTEMPSPLTCLGLQRLERRSSSVERRGRHLDIMEGRLSPRWQRGACSSSCTPGQARANSDLGEMPSQLGTFDNHVQCRC